MTNDNMMKIDFPSKIEIFDVYLRWIYQGEKGIL